MGSSMSLPPATSRSILVSAPKLVAVSITAVYKTRRPAGCPEPEPGCFAPARAAWHTRQVGQAVQALWAARLELVERTKLGRFGSGHSGIGGGGGYAGGGPGGWSARALSASWRGRQWR